MFFQLWIILQTKCLLPLYRYALESQNTLGLAKPQPKPCTLGASGLPLAYQVQNSLQFCLHFSK